MIPLVTEIRRHLAIIEDDLDMYRPAGSRVDKLNLLDTVVSLIDYTVKDMADLRLKVEHTIDDVIKSD